RDKEVFPLNTYSFTELSQEDKTNVISQDLLRKVSTEKFLEKRKEALKKRQLIAKRKKRQEILKSFFFAAIFFLTLFAFRKYNEPENVSKLMVMPASPTVNQKIKKIDFQEMTIP